MAGGTQIGTSTLTDNDTTTYEAMKADATRAWAAEAGASLADGMIGAAQERAAADKAIAAGQTGWMSVLAGLIGTYGLIKQYELQKEQIKLAERGVNQAEGYLSLAQSNYNTIALPAFTRQRDLFDRYLNQFSGYETTYLEDAFRLKEYCPDYALQEGRALGRVQAQFDKAALQRQRQTGKYACGRACHDNLVNSITLALARVDAANHAYRYEEDKKRVLDEWYWKRRSDGARIVDSMAGRVVSGLSGGVAGATGALNGIGTASNSLRLAGQQATAAYDNSSDFWGSISNGAFRMAGYGVGRWGSSMFSGQQSQSPVGNWATTVMPTGGGMNLKDGEYGGTSGLGLYNPAATARSDALYADLFAGGGHLGGM
jgi:hypothetical protein